MSNYRGKKGVRFETLDQPKPVTSEIIYDVEIQIIYDIEPKHNNSKKKSYHYYEYYIILNQDYTGKLSKTINIRNHISE